VARVTFPSWIIFGIVAREADAEHTREAWG
jgi:hypothetical protein